jgi:hypothetical protein
MQLMIVIVVLTEDDVVSFKMDYFVCAGISVYVKHYFHDEIA